MTNDQLLKQNNPVLWAVSYVQSNPGRPVHLRELCAQMHLNYSYFSRQFHQQTGKTFTDYVQGVQMQWASGVLRKRRDRRAAGLSESGRLCQKLCAGLRLLPPQMAVHAGKRRKAERMIFHNSKETARCVHRAASLFSEAYFWLPLMARSACSIRRLTM